MKLLIVTFLALSASCLASDPRGCDTGEEFCSSTEACVPTGTCTSDAATEACDRQPSGAACSYRGDDGPGSGVSQGYCDDGVCVAVTDEAHEACYAGNVDDECEYRLDDVDVYGFCEHDSDEGHLYCDDSASDPAVVACDGQAAGTQCSYRDSADHEGICTFSRTDGMVCENPAVAACENSEDGAHCSYRVNGNDKIGECTEDSDGERVEFQCVSSTNHQCDCEWWSCTCHTTESPRV